MPIFRILRLIETSNPSNEYDKQHIYMTESINGDIKKYFIDTCDLRDITSTDDFGRTVTSEIKAGNKIACIKCGAVFEDDDLAYAHETGLCQYCHAKIKAIWIKK